MSASTIECGRVVKQSMLTALFRSSIFDSRDMCHAVC